MMFGNNRQGQNNIVMRRITPDIFPGAPVAFPSHRHLHLPESVQ